MVQYNNVSSGGSNKSLFERERERLGINQQEENFFAKERERLKTGQKTKFEEGVEQKVDVERWEGRNATTTVAPDPNYNPFPNREQPEKPKVDTTQQTNDGRGGALGFLDSTLGRFSKDFTNVFFPSVIEENERRVREGETDNPILKEQYSQPDGILEKGADVTGTIAGYTAPIGAAYKYTAKPAQWAYKGLTKGKNLGRAGKYLNDAVKGGAAGLAAGAAIETNQELQTPDNQTLGQHAKDIGIEAALGAVGDPLMRGLGAILSNGIKKGMDTPSIQKVVDKFRRGEQDEEVQEMLLLPAPKEVKQPINTMSTDAIPLNQNLKLNAPPTQTRINAKSFKNPYEVKLQNLFNEANRSKLTPGREVEEIEGLWSSIAEQQDPDLFNLIDLAYPSSKRTDFTPQSAFKQARNNQRNAKRTAVYGVDNLFNKLNRQQEYQPPVINEGSVIGQKPKFKIEPQNKSVDKPKFKIEPQKSKPRFKIESEQQAPKMGEQPKQRNFKIEEPTPPKQGERQFINTVRNSSKTSDELLNELQGKGQFKQLSNKEVVERANKILDNGVEEAVDFFKNGKLNPEERIVVGHRLVDEFQKQGNFQRASEIVEELAEQGTQSGRNVQLFSVYNRLTPEGLLVHAQRKANNYNETVNKLNKKVKVTEDMAANLTDSANTVQAMIGQNKQANNVINLMDKVKEGNTLTDEELFTVRSFMQDAKKFVGDVTDTKPKKVKQIPDARKRDKVVDFMSKQEQMAKARIEKRRNAANALPLDLYYDYAVVGASKIAKGTVKLSDFSESMVKDFGEEIRPYMQQIYNKAVETFNIQSEGMTRKRLSETEKVVNKALKDKNITEDEAEAIRLAAKELSRMTGDAKLEASMQIQATLQALDRPSFGQKLATAQIIGQLLNAKTIMRNILGNELFYRIEELSKFVSVPVDMAQSRMFGLNRTVFFRSGNQGKYWENWLKGAKAGWKGLNPEGIQTQYDIGGQTFRSKWNPLTHLEKMLGASLKSFDYAGYKRAYNKQVGQLSKARAYEEGFRGAELNRVARRYMDELDENLIQQADQYGKYATFQDNSQLAVALQRVKRGLNSFPGLNVNKDFGLGDLVLKYPKTPGNLVMRALDYSPIGLLRSVNIAYDGVIKKNPYQSEEFARSLARAITGTAGFSMFGFILAKNGVLTGPRDSDYEVGALERVAGKQSNSINVDALKRYLTGGLKEQNLQAEQGDLFVSFDWAQPVSLSVILGTSIAQSIQEEEELNPTKASKAAFEGATNSIIDLSVLRGLKEATTFYPGQSVPDKGAEILAGLPSSFAPTFGNQINQYSDNQAYSTYDPNLFKKSMNQTKRRVPGLAQTLPKSYTTLGEERQTFNDNTNNLFNVFFNPSFVSRYNPSPEAKYILDFIQQTGDKTVAPRYAPKSITIEGEKYELTPQEHSELQRLMGMETQIRLQQELPNLKTMTDTEDKKKKLDSILRKAGYAARDKLKEMRR